MPLNPLQPVSGGGPAAPATSTAKQELGKGDFLRLLIAQLKNQDPMQPLSDREFIVQLTQFNMLEQIQGMNQALNAMAQGAALGEAAGLLGKHVKGDGVEGPIEGVVTGVSLEGSEAVLELGDRSLPASQVVHIGQTASGGGSGVAGAR